MEEKKKKSNEISNAAIEESAYAHAKNRFESEKVKRYLDYHLRLKMLKEGGI